MGGGGGGGPGRVNRNITFFAGWVIARNLVFFLSFYVRAGDSLNIVRYGRVWV